MPFHDGSDRVAELKRRLDVDPDTEFSDIMYCSCGGLLLDVEETNPPPPPSSATVAKLRGELYGALVLCCDLSWSMDMSLEDQKQSRYKAVTQAIAQLLQDFAGRTDPRIAPEHRYLEAGRSFQYNRLLISVVRFATDFSVFRFPLDEAETTPWFTVQMLAKQEGWHLETDGEQAGSFALSDILATVEEKLLPKKSVMRDGTNLNLALEEVRKLVSDLHADKLNRRVLPATFAGLGGIATAPGRKQLWAAIYTDGQITCPLDKTRRASTEMAQEAPELHRITAFFGKKAHEQADVGGGILREIASVCYAGHAEPQRAYLSPAQALKLRNVVHMATSSDLGICWQCLMDEGGRRSAGL